MAASTAAQSSALAAIAAMWSRLYPSGNRTRLGHRPKVGIAVIPQNGAGIRMLAAGVGADPG